MIPICRIPRELALVLGVLVAAPAVAQEPTQVGAFNDWTVWQYMEGRNRVCFMASEPLDKQPRNVNRGQVYVNVTHKTGIRDEVSFIAGYAYEANNVVTVMVDNTEFKLFTKDETAWTYTKDDDAKMARAMAAGTRMTVKGKSNRGTETTDTYSLSGFTAAHAAMDRACPR
jgi:invasion protein IalB